MGVYYQMLLFPIALSILASIILPYLLSNITASYVPKLACILANFSMGLLFALTASAVWELNGAMLNTCMIGLQVLIVPYVVIASWFLSDAFIGHRSEYQP